MQISINRKVSPLDTCKVISKNFSLPNVARNLGQRVHYDFHRSRTYVSRKTQKCDFYGAKNTKLYVLTTYKVISERFSLRNVARNLGQRVHYDFHRSRTYVPRETQKCDFVR